MGRIRLIVVDDHQIVRQGLRAILESEPDFDVVAEAASAEAALDLVARYHPDVALVDVRMKQMTGIDLCRRLHESAPDTAILILSSYINEAMVRECIQAGARGYLLKDVDGLDLVKSVHSVLQGQAVLAPQAAALLMDLVQQQPDPANITADELELLRYIARGMTNREIAVELYFSENTVKDRVLDLFRKLKAKGRVEAVMEGVRRGLL